MTIIPTFHCGGQCAEAIALYQKAFDLQIDWQGKDAETGLIYHTEAHIGNQRLRLSDGTTEKQGKIQADSLFLTAVFDTAEEAERAFNLLKESGTIVQASYKPDFATHMSELIDKFGFRWFLMVD